MNVVEIVQLDVGVNFGKKKNMYGFFAPFKKFMGFRLVGI